MDRIVVDQLNKMLISGSGTAALRLHQGLQAAGVDSRLWIKRPKRGGMPAINGVRALDWPQSLGPGRAAAWLRKQLAKWQLKSAQRGRPPGCEVFGTPWLPQATPLDRGVLAGNVLHLHWVNGLIDWPSFFAAVPDDLPIVWTLHDMNPITGGCHHADDCRAFATACHTCPQLGRRGPGDLAQAGFATKLAAYRGKKLHLVAPSHWLEKHVRRSALMSGAASVQTIRNGLDLAVYRPLDQSAVRRQLDLPADRLLIGFGAASLKNPRKGAAEVLGALERLPDPDRVCGMALGAKRLPDARRPRPAIVTFGYVDDPQRQAAIYSAMDVFVLPSWAENLPQMAVEAMACGTPVVAFDVGGVPEIVRSGETGWLVPLRDCQGLTERLTWCLDHPPELRRLGQLARQAIEREFDLSATTAAYQRLYTAALAS